MALYKFLGKYASVPLKVVNVLGKVRKQLSLLL